MFTRRWALLFAIGLVNCTGCQSPNVFLDVLVVAADTGDTPSTQLPVNNANVTLTFADGSSTTQQTDSTGNTSFRLAIPGTSRQTTPVSISVTAPGYQDVGAVNVSQFNVNQTTTLTVPMHFSAPAIVFHTSTGSSANPVAQVADVQVSQGGRTIFSGTTTTVAGISTYAGLVVPNLPTPPPTTPYSYIVSAQGFQTANGTVTTHADATAVPVDVLLVPSGVGGQGPTGGNDPNKPLP